MKQTFYRRLSFAAFVWALGTRGETTVTTNPAIFDLNFSSAWGKWRASPDTAQWEDQPEFETYRLGSQPHDMLKDAPSRKKRAPLRGGNIITRETSFEEALTKLLQDHPEMGNTNNWLALADIYLQQTRTEN